MSRVPSSSQVWLLGVLAGALVGLGCTGSGCDFYERCSGEGQYERCSTATEGPSTTRHTCAAPNAACLDVPSGGVKCVYAPAASCDASFVDRCEGSLRVYCDEAFGWVQAVDCQKVIPPAGAGCHVDAPSSKAVCD